MNGTSVGFRNKCEILEIAATTKTEKIPHERAGGVQGSFPTVPCVRCVPAAHKRREESAAPDNSDQPNRKPKHKSPQSHMDVVPTCQRMESRPTVVMLTKAVIPVVPSLDKAVAVFLISMVTVAIPVEEASDIRLARAAQSWCAPLPYGM